MGVSGEIDGKKDGKKRIYERTVSMRTKYCSRLNAIKRSRKKFSLKESLSLLFSYIFLKF